MKIENLFHFNFLTDFADINTAYDKCLKCDNYKRCIIALFDICNANHYIMLPEYHKIFCSTSYCDYIYRMFLLLAQPINTYDYYDDYFPQLTPFHLHLYYINTMF